jgi:hypothetical protein
MMISENEFVHLGILYRRYTDGQIGFYRVTPLPKPILRTRRGAQTEP